MALQSKRASGLLGRHGQLSRLASLTSLAQSLCVSPIKSGARTCKDPAAVREKGDEFGVPAPHLTPAAPEGSKYGTEIPPSAAVQGAHEFGTLALWCAGPNNLELLTECSVGIDVVADRVANVKHPWFF